MAQQMPDVVHGSPFSGMDPYLESLWGDFQSRMSTYISNQRHPLLPEYPSASRIPAVEAHGAVAVQPVVVMRYSEPAVVRYVKIIEIAGSGRIVTSIEVISPTNKLSTDGIDYKLDPHPPLRGEDAEWADQLLKEKGKRPASDE